MNRFPEKGTILSTSLSSLKIRSCHKPNTSDLSVLRNIQKTEKQNKNLEVHLEKFNSVESEWTRYKTTKNCSKKISFKKTSKLSEKKEQNKEILNIATKAFQLLGQKSNKPSGVIKKSSQLSLLINSANKELGRNK